MLTHPSDEIAMAKLAEFATTYEADPVAQTLVNVLMRHRQAIIDGVARSAFADALLTTRAFADNGHAIVEKPANPELVDSVADSLTALLEAASPLWSERERHLAAVKAMRAARCCDNSVAAEAQRVGDDVFVDVDESTRRHAAAVGGPKVTSRRTTYVLKTGALTFERVEHDDTVDRYAASLRLRVWPAREKAIAGLTLLKSNEVGDITAANPDFRFIFFRDVAVCRRSADTPVVVFGYRPGTEYQVRVLSRASMFIQEVVPAFQVFGSLMMSALAALGATVQFGVDGANVQFGYGPLVGLWDIAQRLWSEQHRNCMFDQPFRPIYADNQWWVTEIDHKAVNRYIAAVVHLEHAPQPPLYVTLMRQKLVPNEKRR
jgi:membrane-associated protease RseP (regulator of RpoE activity)